MVSLKSLENEKKNIIKSFKPEEFEAYLTSLVNLYYESYLAQDKEKHLAVDNLINESVKIYETKYTNTSKNEVIYKLNKANELLGISLDEKDKLKVELSKVIVENGLENKIKTIMFSNSILRRLIDSYEKEPSGTLASTIKDVAENIESHLIGIKFLLENKHEVYTVVYVEEYEILAEEYSIFQELQKKINSL